MVGRSRVLRAKVHRKSRFVWENTANIRSTIVRGEGSESRKRSIRSRRLRRNVSRAFENRQGCSLGDVVAWCRRSEYFTREIVSFRRVTYCLSKCRRCFRQQSHLFRDYPRVCLGRRRFQRHLRKRPSTRAV